MLMAAATDLLVIFLALEILSLAVYVLTGIRRASATGAEAAFKYFLLGAFSSAFFLYGIAFTLRGRRLDAARADRRGAVGAGRRGAADAGAARRRPARGRLRVQGLGGAVPHVDARRLRRRADASSPAFMSTGVKAAAFAAFVRVFLSPLEPLQAHWVPVLVGRSPRRR